MGSRLGKLLDASGGEAFEGLPQCSAEIDESLFGHFQKCFFKTPSGHCRHGQKANQDRLSYVE